MREGWEAGVPRRDVCWSSSSFICASLSISMMSGRPRTINEVATIHAALPVLFIRRFATYAASQTVLFPFRTIEESETRDSVLTLARLDLLKDRFFFPTDTIVVCGRSRFVLCYLNPKPFTSLKLINYYIGNRVRRNIF